MMVNVRALTRFYRINCTKMQFLKCNFLFLLVCYIENKAIGYGKGFKLLKLLVSDVQTASKRLQSGDTLWDKLCVTFDTKKHLKGLNNQIRLKVYPKISRIMFSSRCTFC